jgi:hypothetical protein
MEDFTGKSDEYLIDTVRYFRKQIENLNKAIAEFEKSERKYCAELVLRGYENVK